MNCPTCAKPMVRVRSGGLCLQCNGKIHPWVDEPKPCVPGRRRKKLHIPEAHFVDMVGTIKRWKIAGLDGFYQRVNSWDVGVGQDSRGNTNKWSRMTTPGVPISARMNGKSTKYVRCVLLTGHRIDDCTCPECAQKRVEQNTGGELC